MTAIVGIINRQGSAFAADSAATHTISPDKRVKITNHANKIFELSKYQPIGVAICGNLSFMGIPWEDMFKLYRKKLSKTHYPRLVDYVNDFMKYARSTILPMYQEDQKQQLVYLCNSLINEVVNIAREEIVKKGKDEKSIDSQDLFPEIVKIFKNFINLYDKEEMKAGKDFEEYTLEQFSVYAKESISIATKDVCGDQNCPEDFIPLFTKTLYNVLVSKKHTYLATTEIVFWGYGDNELYPSCYSVVISAAFDNKIKWTVGTDVSVTNISSAWIIPFAQIDVSNTVVRGVDQVLRDKFSETAGAVLSKFKKDLTDKFEQIGMPEELLTAMSSLDLKPYRDLYKMEMDQYILENYINKLMDTVSFMMKEDLADMAESLVKMTCLKRHFTSEEETVGGPVDVAVITKGDGFVWIKRKHYFSADINHHYFERQDI